MMNDVLSPCINICKLENGVCSGCGRSKRDIKNWSQYNNETKYQIVHKIKKKKAWENYRQSQMV
jgi:predicted Fe-S protein YdhL (DUF1289 family)